MRGLIAVAVAMLILAAPEAWAQKPGGVLRITHRDEVEAPITDWLREAYELSDALVTRTAAIAREAPKRKVAKRTIAARRKASVKKPPARKRSRRG